jgi:predicted short-subunit dehydrogenase-like oxidoreductase (DUF2520 family)
MQAFPIAKEKPVLAIIGCGKVGTAMGKLLGRAGYPISGVVTSRLETARKAADEMGADTYSDRSWDVSPGGEVVFITTPDDLIASTCRKIAERRGFHKNAVVIHCSGALSSRILDPAKSCGALVATLHPLQSFASVEQALGLVPGSFCTIEGDQEALPVVREIVADIGGVPLEITAERKTLYHAAAVAASNYFVAVMGLAVELNKAAGLPDELACDALLPLVRGTLSNISVQGIPDALTGPIARGDVATVSAHIEAIRRVMPEFLSLYRCLGLYTVELAKAKKSINHETEKELMNILRD